MYSKSLILNKVNELSDKLEELNNRLNNKNINFNNIQETIVPSILNKQSLIDEIEQYKDLLY